MVQSRVAGFRFDALLVIPTRDAGAGTGAS